jgi:hypothetical protein
MAKRNEANWGKDGKANPGNAPGESGVTPGMIHFLPRLSFPSVNVSVIIRLVWTAQNLHS